MKTCSYWTAGHITAFFKIADSSNDELHKGSLGCGFNIKRGVRTDVSVSNQKTHQIYFNSEKQFLQAAGITTKILNEIEKYTAKTLPSLIVRHWFEVPIGAGYGSSAAAALSTAFAVNKLLDLKIPELILWQLAHKTEIYNKTGLGDILGLYSKSKFELRVKEGAPGVGSVVPLNFDIGDYDLYTHSIGPLSKKYLLTDPGKRSQISLYGEKSIKEFELAKTFENFCKVSLSFTKSLNLLPKELKEIVESLPPKVKCAQIMLGESLFFFVPKNEDIPKFNSILLTKEELANETLKELESEGF